MVETNTRTDLLDAVGSVGFIAPKTLSKKNNTKYKNMALYKTPQVMLTDDDFTPSVIAARWGIDTHELLFVTLMVFACQFLVFLFPF